MHGLLQQNFIRSAVCPSVRQFSSNTSQQDIKSAFSYCSEQVRCALACYLLFCMFIELETPCYPRRTYDYDNYVWMLQLKQVRPTHTCHCVLADLQTSLSMSSRCAGTQSSLDCYQMFQRRNWTGGGECQRNRLASNTHAVVAGCGKQRISG